MREVASSRMDFRFWFSTLNWVTFCFNKEDSSPDRENELTIIIWTTNRLKLRKRQVLIILLI
ncbi:MAG: hypothetical protein A3J72_09135 [Nitrospirae bacterium RIFCSPHIGHO2_02_FULL_40_19]|nr:MAG: hypothetical protein A3J72_09135 [Nitrospirae bacterium RIFCSPHIGHO2_02_FULL_40_19]